MHNMNILIVNMGNLVYNLASTSIIKSIQKKLSDAKITWVVNNEEYKSIFKFNNNVNKVCNISEIPNKKYDVCINLFPADITELHIQSNYFLGFGYNDSLDYLTPYLTEDKIPHSSFYLFQVIHWAAGLIWKGQSYDISYFPHSKQKINRLGIKSTNDNIKNYIKDKLNVDNMKVYYLPYKKNILKRMDEINKCSRIITDDLLTCHLAISLRKFVIFLQKVPMPFKIEFFGKGVTIHVPKAIYL